MDGGVTHISVDDKNALVKAGEADGNINTVEGLSVAGSHTGNGKDGAFFVVLGEHKLGADSTVAFLDSEGTLVVKYLLQGFLGKNRAFSYWSLIHFAAPP